MFGGMIMETNSTMSTTDISNLLKELDKGIEDMESGRLTAHEESVKILMQRYNDHVLQDKRNG